MIPLIRRLNSLFDLTPQDGVALGGGGPVGSLHHELALQPSGVLLRYDTAHCGRHQHVALHLQDLILADGCACGTGMWLLLAQTDTPLNGRSVFVGEGIHRKPQRCI